MLTDKIGDLITRIRNGHRANHKDVRVIKSNLAKRILDVLQREGYIVGHADHDAHYIRVDLKYLDGESAIKKIQRVSKPGCRRYSAIKDVRPVYNGLGLNILSTSKGVMSDYEAIQQNVGGELLFKVF